VRRSLACYALAAGALAQPAAAQDATESRELTGHIGRRQVVMSLYALCWNLLPLGGLLGGVLAAAVSARFAVLVGGAMVAANALVLLASRRLRLL